MQVRKGDPSVSSGWRAELETPGVSDTGDRWYGWAMKFKTPLSADGLYWKGSYGGHFVQWHPDNGRGSASLSLWGSDGVWDVATNPEGDGTAVHHAPGNRKILANVWHKVVFHVNWSTGVVQFWLNDELLVNLTGINYAAGPGQYFKFGMNRWGNGSGGAPTDSWDIQYDALRIGGPSATYADVVPGCGNSGGNPSPTPKPTNTPAAPTPTPVGVQSPSNLNYSNANASYTVGVAIPNNMPSNSGGVPTSYAVSPALPAGLSLSVMSGIISGTPNVAKAVANYTVTASNSAGSASKIISIVVNAAVGPSPTPAPTNTPAPTSVPGPTNTPGPTVAPTGSLSAVATYQSLGLYMSRPASMSSMTSAPVRYRKLGAADWSNGIPLWYDSRSPAQFRGSLMDLQAGTQYEVQVTDAAGSTIYASNTFSTWTESANLPLGAVTNVGNRSTQIIINAASSGTASAYKVWTNGSIDMGWANQADDNGACIIVDGASYVIIRALVLKNCKASGVELRNGAHDVIIEGNDISNFGYTSFGNTPVQGETGKVVLGDNERWAGVYCSEGKGKGVNKITVQGNKIHDPRTGSNAWVDDHPYGGNGIGFMEGCGGNNVYRYNDVLGSQGHYFMDGIGGGNNFTATGFPNLDSDIIGNYVSRIYDDCIEAEGGNKNVRVMRNYLTGCFIAIANGTVTKGPIYNIRNITGTHAGVFNPNLSSYQNEAERGIFFKLGSQDSSMAGGKAYYLNNTALQNPCPGGGTCGVEGFMYNSAGNVLATNIESANNIFSSSKNSPFAGSYSGGAMSNSQGTWSNELIGNGSVGVTVSNIINGQPTYNSDVDEKIVQKTYSGGYNKAYVPTRSPNDIADFSLAVGSKGKGAAKVIPNVTDMYASPDVGAHQAGTGPMLFGTALWSGPKAY